MTRAEYDRLGNWCELLGPWEAGVGSWELGVRGRSGSATSDRPEGTPPPTPNPQLPTPASIARALLTETSLTPSEVLERWPEDAGWLLE